MFNERFRSDEGNEKFTGIQNLLKQKSKELARLDTAGLMEQFIGEQTKISHFDQIDYSIEYAHFWRTKNSNKRVQNIRRKIISFLGINISIEDGFQEIYKDEVNLKLI
jgi:hypothetical protein